MSAYNWIVIMLCIGFVGLLYACTYDAVAQVKDDAYMGTKEARTATNILWKCWQFLPICILVAGIAYGVLASQKG